MIKLAASILLSSLLLFQSAGWYLCHYWQVQEVRHEMKQRLKQGVPEELQVVLKIPFSMEEGHPDFQRIHKGEFRYKGEMYDILKSARHGSETWYTCIHDVKESGLFKNLDRMVSLELKNNPEKRKHRSLMQALFSKQFVGESLKKITAYVAGYRHQFRYSTVFYHDVSLKPWKPPRPLFYIFQ